MRQTGADLARAASDETACLSDLAGDFCAHAALSGWVGLRAAQGRALASGIYLFAYYMGSSLLGTVSGLAWGQGAWLAVAGFLAVLLGLALLIVWRLRQQVRTTLTQVGA